MTNGEAILGSLSEGYTSILIHDENLQTYVPALVNDQSKEVQRQDPRLKKLLEVGFEMVELE